MYPYNKHRENEALPFMLPKNIKKGNTFCLNNNFKKMLNGALRVSK